jgi:glycosyltransferase involved in cell wall biosynthesis
MEQMKILFVNHTSSYTGDVISCFHIMTMLGDPFLPFFAAREEGPMIERAGKAGIKSFIIKKRGFLGLSYIASFTKIIRSEKFDIVHLNTLTPFCKYAGIASFLQNIPIVWVVRENPLISRSRRLAFWLKYLSSNIVFVDSDTKEKLLHDELTDKVKVIPNGVDIDYFKPSQSDFLFKRFHIKPDGKLIGYVGLITKRKGLEYLIGSLPGIKKKCNTIKLIIIGGHAPNDSDYFTGIKELIKELSLENDVYFTNLLSDVRDALNSLDIVVLPSLEERCSRTLLESMACAKAVVATRVGGTPEIIKDGTTGILVEPENTKQIEEAILKLLADDNLRHRMGINSRIHIERYFDIRNNVNAMRELYLSLKKN